MKERNQIIKFNNSPQEFLQTIQPRRSSIPYWYQKLVFQRPRRVIPNPASCFTHPKYNSEVVTSKSLSSLNCSIWHSFCSFFYSRVYSCEKEKTPSHPYYLSLNITQLDKWWVSNRIQTKEKGNQ